MNSFKALKNIPICLIGYGFITAILSFVILVLPKSLFIGYSQANISEDGRCAISALIAQHMIMATIFYWIGIILKFRILSKLSRLVFIVSGVLLIAWSYLLLIIAAFCAG